MKKRQKLKNTWIFLHFDWRENWDGIFFSHFENRKCFDIHSVTTFIHQIHYTKINPLNFSSKQAMDNNSTMSSNLSYIQ